MAVAVALVLAVSIFLSTVPADGRLLLVSLLYRHGDRSPITTFPADKHSADSWPQGYGQLTKLGMQQHYNLGRFLRLRYKDFVNSSYIRSEVVARSTDVDRTLHSAYSNFAGFYATAANSVGNLNSSWQPVPVHTVPVKDDILLGLAPCKTREDTIKSYMSNSEEVVAFTSKYQSFISTVRTLAGYKEQPSLLDLLTVRDSLYCQMQNGFVVPDWARWTNLTSDGNKTTMDVLSELTDLGFRLITMGQQVRRLSAGTLVGEIVKNMEKAATGGSSTKLFVYSAHDSTVAAFLSALDVFDGKTPRYTASVMVELSVESGEPMVTVYYKNGVDVTDPKMLQLRGCSAHCPLSHFKSLTSGIVPEDYKAECGSTSGLSRDTIVAISVCVPMILSLIVVIICLQCRRARAKANASLRWTRGAQASTATTDETEVMLAPVA